MTRRGAAIITAGRAPQTFVAPSIFLTHRRADLYPEPGVFRPERFLAGSRIRITGCRSAAADGGASACTSRCSRSR